MLREGLQRVDCASMGELTDEQLDSHYIMFRCNEHWQQCALGTCSSGEDADSRYVKCRRCNSSFHLACVDFDEQTKLPFTCEECNRHRCAMNCTALGAIDKQLCRTCIYGRLSSLFHFTTDRTLRGECDYCGLRLDEQDRRLALMRVQVCEGCEETWAEQTEQEAEWTPRRRKNRLSSSVEAAADAEAADESSKDSSSSGSSGSSGQSTWTERDEELDAELADINDMTKWDAAADKEADDGTVIDWNLLPNTDADSDCDMDPSAESDEEEEAVCSEDEEADRVPADELSEFSDEECSRPRPTRTRAGRVSRPAAVA